RERERSVSRARASVGFAAQGICGEWFNALFGSVSHADVRHDSGLARPGTRYPPRTRPGTALTALQFQPAEHLLQLLRFLAAQLRPDAGLELFRRPLRDLHQVRDDAADLALAETAERPAQVDQGLAEAVLIEAHQVGVELPPQG